MCNCKMCDWLKGLFGKKNCCETKGCCEEKKTEEAVTPVAPTEEPKVEEPKVEETVAPAEEKKEDETAA